MVRGIFCLRERGGGDEAGQSETGAERKNRAEEAEAERKNRAEEAEADAAADEKTSGRDTMPGRMFRFKECSLTYQSFNQMFFHNSKEFRLE